MTRTLVAGVGNVLAGDDGFGCEVVRRVAAHKRSPHRSPGVSIVDFGVRGLHLAYHLLEEWDRVIFVDAVSRGGAVGTVYLLELDAATLAALPGSTPADAHGTDLGKAIVVARAMGAKLHSLLLVGCEPGDLDERMGLSPPVERAADEAVGAVLRLLDGLTEPAAALAPAARENSNEEEASKGR